MIISDALTLGSDTEQAECVSHYTFSSRCIMYVAHEPIVNGSQLKCS